ncbi:MAG TPA: hypothetical protein VMG11_15360 [Steroidobacteraceae bacterium]|nr:hypothetical protein [Steroidobacteraceae bacterium]
MAAVLVALYDSHASAVQVRTALVHDGFPTDRVALTSAEEQGRAADIPAGRSSERFRAYFAALFDEEPERRRVNALAERVRKGAAAITVHPRGEQEVTRALEILGAHRPVEVDQEHLDDTTLEHAASDHERPYLARVLTGNRPEP